MAVLKDVLKELMLDTQKGKLSVDHLECNLDVLLDQKLVGKRGMKKGE